MRYPLSFITAGIGGTVARVSTHLTLDRFLLTAVQPDQ